MKASLGASTGSTHTTAASASVSPALRSVSCVRTLTRALATAICCVVRVVWELRESAREHCNYGGMRRRRRARARRKKEGRKHSIARRRDRRSEGKFHISLSLSLSFCSPLSALLPLSLPRASPSRPRAKLARTRLRGRARAAEPRRARREAASWLLFFFFSNRSAKNESTCFVLRSRPTQLFPFAFFKSQLFFFSTTTTTKNL